MAIMTLYVNAPSKKAINDRLAQGREVSGTCYTPCDDTEHLLDANLADGTVIKVFDRYVLGSPYAKAYGNWDARKLRVK